MMSRPAVPATHTRLRPFAPDDLDALVAFWNRAFAGRRNFYPLMAADFRQRVLDCPAFDPGGLILAWQGDDPQATLVGMVHAFRPPPDTPVYNQWGRHHTLALIYVVPEMRRQGIGARLLRAAENWLYYCPIFVASQAQPCYGTLEAPQSPFFGSTQRLGISPSDGDLIRFLAHRGYRPHDPGEVSLRLESLGAPPLPTAPDLQVLGLQLQPFGDQAPFTGREQPGRHDFSYCADSYCADTHSPPYAGYAITDADGLLWGHISWYPMRRAGWAAIANFWLAPRLRRRGLGRYLLASALHEMAHAPAPRGGFHAVEVQSHVVHHAVAVALYEQHGFRIDETWVSLVKT